MKRIISIILATAIVFSFSTVFLGVSFAEAETEKLLKIEYDGTGAGQVCYMRLGWCTPEIKAGDYLEYDVWLTDDLAGVGGLDFAGEGSRYCRDFNEYMDVNGIKGHPKNDISDYAYQKWYSRKVKLASVVNGTSDNFVIVAFEGLTAKTTAYFDNIRITRDDEVLEYAFKDGGTEYRYIGSHYSGIENKITVSTVEKSAVDLPEISHPDEVEVTRSLIAQMPDRNSVNDMNFELLDRAVKAFENLTEGDKALIDGSALESANELYKAYNDAKLGDVDQGGTIGVEDALLALQHAVGKITLDGVAQKSARVTEDRQISVNTALMILQRAVGKINFFPTEDRELTLLGKDAEMRLAVGRTEVSVTSLVNSENNINMINEPVAVSMPISYSAGDKTAEFDWKLASAEDYTCTESDVSGNAALTGVKLTYTDSEAGFDYEIYVLSTDDYAGPFQFSEKLVNRNDSRVTVSLSDFFNASLDGREQPTAMKIRTEGQTYYADGLQRVEMNDGISIATNTSTSQSGTDDVPMIYLDYGDKGVYAALEWPSGSMLAKRKGDAVKMSVYFPNFTTRVDPQTALEIPTVYFGAYDGDIEEGSNAFKRWFYNTKSPKILREDPNEPLTQMDMQVGLQVDRVGGIESVKWDNGWWADAEHKIINGWGGIEGDWNEVRDPRYVSTINAYGCADLKEFAALCTQKGINLTTYVLLHDAKNNNPDALTSIGPNGHPEWFVGYTNTDGEFADLGNTDCVNWLKEKLLNFFKGNGVRTWRTDFEPIAEASNKDNRHFANGTDVQYWNAVGFYEIVDYIYANYSDFRYENCSSGGSLKDFATLSRTVYINNDDSADFNSLRTTFYDSSYCFPSSQLQAPANMDKCMPDCSQYYIDGTNPDFGFRSVIMGSIMFASWSGPKDGSLQFGLEEYYDKYIKMYKEKIKPLVRDADLYHVLPRPDGINWDGVEYIDADSENEIKGAVFVFKPSAEGGNTNSIKLRGLEKTKKYTLEFEDNKAQGLTLTGNYLMTKGVSVTLRDNVDSEIIWIKEAQ